MRRWTMTVAFVLCVLAGTRLATNAKDPTPAARIRDANGNTPLHHVCYRTRNTKAADQLIRSKADINARNRLQQTPLHLAASCDWAPIVERLLEAGATIDARDRNGKTPLHYAAIYHQDAILELLRQRGAKTDIKDRFGRTAEDIANESLLWTQTLRTDTGNATYVDICYALDTFVVVGKRGRIMTSLDGANWTPQHCSYPYDFRSIDYVNGVFVALGEYGESFISEGGINWTRRQIDPSDGMSFHAIAYGNGHFVVAGPHASVFVSIDGIRWSRQPVDTDSGLAGISFYNGSFLCMTKTAQLFSSPQGITWKPHPPPPRGTPVVTGIHSFKDRVIIVGTSGLIAYASRIDAWRVARTDCLQTIHDVIRGAQHYIAVGDEGTLLVSRNGHDWLLRNPGTTLPLTGAAYGNTVFAVVGTEGIWTYQPGTEAGGTPEERLAADIAGNVSQLDDTRIEMRDQAKRKLIIIGTPALHDLQELLCNNEAPTEARSAAASIITDIGGAEAATALTNELDTTIAPLQRDVAQGLLQLADPSTFPGIQNILEKTNLAPHVRQILIDTLGQFGDTRSVRLLLPLVGSDPDPSCRQAASAALDRITKQSHGQDQRARMRWIRRFQPEWLETVAPEASGPTYHRLSGLILGGALLGFLMIVSMLRS